MVPVATAFVVKDNRLLLLLRPKTAPTYPGMWSAVSGLIEDGETPQQAAVREAKEETGLAIRIERTGEPFRADGFEIHPFLARADSNEVTLDWENETHAWVQFNQLANYRTVPGVREAFEALVSDKGKTNPQRQPF